MLDEVNQRLAQNEIHLDVTEKVKEKLVDLGYDPKMGARPLRRTIQDHIEDAITDYYLEHPSEKQLKAVMTSNGNNSIKAAQICQEVRSIISKCTFRVGQKSVIRYNSIRRPLRTVE